MVSASEKLKPRNICMSDNMWEKLCAEAASSDISVAEIVRRAVENRTAQMGRKAESSLKS